MTIQYIEPLSRGIARSKKDLFNPWNPKNWFVVGFTAFLAGLTDFGFSGLPGSSWRNRGAKIDVEDILYWPQRGWEWLGRHPMWAFLIGALVFFGLVIGIILTWLSSRGKFMFLDNVVYSQARVAIPWNEYRREGNSFFFFTLLWGCAVFAVSVVYLFYAFLHLQRVHQLTGDVRALIVPAILAGAGFVLITIAANFIYLMLCDFVVPIMYRDRTTISVAFQKFMLLFLSDFIYFVGYGLFKLCLGIAIVIGIAIAGCLTCCIGFIVLAIPYLNAVLLLPISYAMRAFSIEFLQQFGPGYDIFIKTGEMATAAPPVMES
jgi:hypothetical protein